MKKHFRILGGILAVWLACAPLAIAQPRNDQEIRAPKPYTAKEADDYLDGFRRAWLLSDLGLKFDFLHRPRHGDETRFTGQGWTSMNQGYPVTRFQLVKVSANKVEKPEVYEWLLQNGPAPRVWILAPGATAAREVPKEQWRAPLLPGMIYTPFDLMMPFLFWKDYKYEGTDRILGRGVDIYTMNPPPVEKASGIGPVKLFIDRELNALVRTQQLDAKGAVTLQFDLGHVAKIEDQWMFEDCELLNKVNGDYDQFIVRAVALKLKLEPAVFDPANLAKPVPPQPASVWHSM